MLKVLSLMKRKEGISHAEFRDWAINKHPPIAKKLPGLLGYRMNVLLAETPDAPYDAISEMWFESADTRAAALATEAGKAAAADAIAHAASRFHFVAEEKVFS